MLYSIKLLNLYSIYNVMTATKRIPVSKETWKKLGEQKDSGQTWDELLEELRIEVEKKKLAEKSRKAKNGELETVALDDV